MTYKENITAILECHFGGFKEEIIDSACNSILELEPCEYAPFTIAELKNEDMQKLLREFKNQRVIVTDHDCLPSATIIEPCDVSDINVGDMISRQAVLDILDDMTKDYAKSNDFEKVNGVAWVKVQKLPSVNPQKIGHWILTDDDFVYCSECEDSYYPRPIDADWYYCPHCGARMESEET